MARYQHTTIRRNKNKRGLSDTNIYETNSKTSTIYSAIPESDDDIHVITQTGDRFDLLAHQFYGDVNLWWYIAKANGLTFMTIPVGTKLRIPASTEFAIGY